MIRHVVNILSVVGTAVVIIVSGVCVCDLVGDYYHEWSDHSQANRNAENYQYILEERGQ